MTQTDYELPDHAIAAEGGPLPASQDSTILEMRWSDPTYVWELWKLLADLTPVESKGRVYLVRQEDNQGNPLGEPLMNYQGAKVVIQKVKSILSTAVSLSYIDEQTAKYLIRERMLTLNDYLHLNMRELGIKDAATADFILEEVQPFIFCQLNRPIKGHESKSAHTSTQEYRQDVTSEHRTGGGMSIFTPWRKK